MKSPKVFWLFGRCGAGKTTLAKGLREGLAAAGLPVIYLDGDDLRSGLCSDLGFSAGARLENHRRTAEVAGIAVRQGFNVVVATMAPQHAHRDTAAKILGKDLVWMYVDAPLEVCVARDPKGLYRRAGRGKLADLLGFPFEEPRPHEQENHIDTVAFPVKASQKMVKELAWKHVAPAN